MNLPEPIRKILRYEIYVLKADPYGVYQAGYLYTPAQIEAAYDAYFTNNPLNAYRLDKQLLRTIQTNPPYRLVRLLSTALSLDCLVLETSEVTTPVFYTEGKNQKFV